MPDVLSVGRFFIELADKLRILDAIKVKLLGAPDIAAKKLEAALWEIEKTYNAINEMLLAYLSLDFDQASQQEERRQLLQLEGGDLTTQVHKARTHCHKIGRIYNEYLKSWFGRVLARDEQEQMEQLFQSLSEMDLQVLYHTGQLAKWLTDRARETLDLIDNHQLPTANQRIRDARREVQPLRQAITQSRNMLSDLQAEFAR